MEGCRKMLSELIHYFHPSQNNIRLIKSKNVSLTRHSGKIHKSTEAHEILSGKSNHVGDQSVSLSVTFTCFLKLGGGMECINSVKVCLNTNKSPSSIEF